MEVNLNRTPLKEYEIRHVLKSFVLCCHKRKSYKKLDCIARRSALKQREGKWKAIKQKQPLVLTECCCTFSDHEMESDFSRRLLMWVMLDVSGRLSSCCICCHLTVSYGLSIISSCFN